MPRNKKLLPREKRFIRYYAETGKVGESALRAGYTDPNYGSQLLAKEKITTAIDRKMDQIGLNDETMLKSLKQGIKARTPARYAKLEKDQDKPQVLIPSAPDHQNRPRYIDIYCKLKKLYAPEGSVQDNRVQFIQIVMTPDRVKGLIDSGKITKKEAKKLKELKHEPIRDEEEVEASICE